jgi:hypothetical protein
MSTSSSDCTCLACSIGAMRILALVLAAFTAQNLRAQLEVADADEAVIHYYSDEGLADPVARLQVRLAKDQASLHFREPRGYLDALLKELGIRSSSQGLVFSKTSSQADRTSPRTPRAVYFNDDVCVAWVPGAPVIDIEAVDPQRGPIFYTLEQRTNGKPRFTRNAECMRCHLGRQTVNVPGLLVRSFYTAADGRPLAKVLNFVNGHNSPLQDRWGGWYVTGTHAGDLHLGNIFANDPAHPERADLKAGANLIDLRDRFDATQYLSPHSDLVALLVLEHQSRMQNLITHANYETRLALDPEVAQGEKRSPIVEGELGPTSSRIAAAGEALLEYMLFRNEAPLKGPVKGTSNFTSEFEQAGVRDSRTRSLREFDLKSRLFRYPCSYMIYTASFDGLPREMKNYLWRRLGEILVGDDRGPDYASMGAEDRRAVREILLETKPEFAAWVQQHRPAFGLSLISR